LAREIHGPWRASVLLRVQFAARDISFKNWVEGINPCYRTYKFRAKGLFPPASLETVILSQNRPVPRQWAKS
jgi:hypothetical protein